MLGETQQLLNALRTRHSPFLVARIFLKIGREVPDHFNSVEDDQAMARLVRETCLALGVKLPPGG
jgi:hypothetical protein